MIPRTLPLMLTTLFGCATLRELLPSGPVLSAEARAGLRPITPATVTYTGDPLVSFPVLPLQVFGLRYAADIVLVSEHPDWDMHEYARIDLPSGSVWIAKDADRDKVQTITAPLEHIETWLPEIPAPRRQGALSLEDRSTGTLLDVSLAYENPHGQAVEVDFQAPTKPKIPGKRNGNTMGHKIGRAHV